MGRIHVRRIARLVTGSMATLGVAFAGPASAAPSLPVLFHPMVAEYFQMTTSTTPPTEAQCFSAGRRCFAPAATQAAYDLAPLYAGGFTGKGVTIAIVDSYGSDTIAHDLHVYDQAFNLQPMCGEEGVTCSAGMPTFSQLHVQGSPATTAPPATSNGTGQENKAGWAVEVSLDVETAHAIAPEANILLVTTPTAETLGVQGFPDMMNAEQFVVDHGLANVISQSFASTEEAFGSSTSLLQLRHAFISAAQNGVTVLAGSGDFGSEGVIKTPVSVADPTNTVTRVVDSTDPPGKCRANPGVAEVGWTFSGGGFSHVFSKPDYQSSLPAGSTPIGSMRGIPDIALQASAGTGALIYVSLPPAGSGGLICGTAPCSSGWFDIGGTSLGTPQWAGLVAIADQINGHGLGLINPALYKLGADPARYANDFFDVTTGNNTADPSVPGYPATTGWDPVTGLGTPDAANLLPDLVAAVNGH